MPMHATLRPVVASIALLALSAQAPAPVPSTATYARADGAKVEARVFAASVTGCAPLAIISHGLGGTSRGNSQLAEALNKAGFRVVLPSHAESGPPLLKEIATSGDYKSMLNAKAADKQLLSLRLDDISAILDVELKRCAVPFKLLAGHSMGARTTSLEAGAGNSIQIRGKDRFDAYVAISPLAEGSLLFPIGAMKSITKPMLLITGTRDQAEAGAYGSRKLAYDGLQPGRKRFAVIENANHFQLGGTGDGKVGRLVGAIAVEFAQNVKPGPWRAAEVRPGVTISEK